MLMGVANMLNDYHEAQFIEGRTEDDPEETKRHSTTCLTWHRNHFITRQRFFNRMPMDV
jgi:hypothetical protein